MSIKDKKYHILYETTNLINGKKYIGVHSTNNLNDSYIGSGKLINAAFNKWSRDAFERFIIKGYDTREDAIKAERKYIDKKYIARSDTYNLQLGGGACHEKIISEKAKRKMIAAQKISQKKRYEDPEARKKQSDGTRKRFKDHPEQREKMGQSIKEKWKNPKYRNKTHAAIKEGWKRRKESMTPEDVKRDHEKRSQKAIERWEKARKNGSDKLSDEHKNKISEAGKKRWAKYREEKNHKK